MRIARKWWPQLRPDTLGNQIGNEGARALADALRENTTVRHIFLRENGIGAEGARALVDGLRENATLMAMYLNGNQISDAVQQAVLRLVEQNRDGPEAAMERVNPLPPQPETLLTEESLSEHYQAFPSVSVVNPDGLSRSSSSSSSSNE
jgi:hypothetical protein